MSAGTTECVTPLKPPITNIPIKPSANNIGVLRVSFPPQIVPSQLNIFTPVGTAIIIVDNPNPACATGLIADANIWCAHTPKPIKAIPKPAKTIAGYPKSGFLENVGSTSDTIPKAGSISMYTSG